MTPISLYWETLSIRAPPISSALEHVDLYWSKSTASSLHFLGSSFIVLIYVRYNDRQIATKVPGNKFQDGEVINVLKTGTPFPGQLVHKYGKEKGLLPGHQKGANPPTRSSCWEESLN